MSRFGIQNCRPRWLNGRSSITMSHGQRLAGLAGLTLRHVWLLWDLADNEWFADAPVLLQFGDQQVAIDYQKFDDVSLTWYTIDPARQVEDDFFRLAWRPEPLPELTELPGRTLNHVELLAWSGDRHDMAERQHRHRVRSPARVADHLQRPRRERDLHRPATSSLPSAPHRPPARTRSAQRASRVILILTERPARQRSVLRGSRGGG